MELDLTGGKDYNKLEIERLLEDGFGTGNYQIMKFTGGEHNHIHLEVHVQSIKFNGLSMLDQHRMVMNTLGEKMRKEIHAIIIKTRAI